MELLMSLAVVWGGFTILNIFWFTMFGNLTLKDFFGEVPWWFFAFAPLVTVVVLFNYFVDLLERLRDRF